VNGQTAFPTDTAGTIVTVPGVKIRVIRMIRRPFLSNGPYSRRSTTVDDNMSNRNDTYFFTVVGNRTIRNRRERERVSETVSE